MYDIYEHQLKLNEFEDKMVANGVSHPPPEARVDLSGSEWIKYDDFRLKLLEHKVRNRLERLVCNLRFYTAPRILVQVHDNQFRSVGTTPLLGPHQGLLHAISTGTRSYHRASGSAATDIRRKRTTIRDDARYRIHTLCNPLIVDS